jgi:hypothetical protein
MTMRLKHTPQGFYVQALVDDNNQAILDITCPIKCGVCCGYWNETITLRNLHKGQDPTDECPYLKATGCGLPRKVRPIECTAYLCELATLAVMELVTQEEITRALDSSKQHDACEFLGKELHAESAEIKDLKIKSRDKKRVDKLFQKKEGLP